MYKRSKYFTVIVVVFLLSCTQQELIDDTPKKKEIEKYPTKSITHFMYGEIYRSSGNYTYANLEYKRALEYDTTVTILNAIGESYIALGKPNQASDYFEKALGLDPNDEIAGLNVIDLYMKNQRYEEVIPLLEAKLKIDPDIPEYMQWLAEAYRGVKDYASSISILDKMIIITKDYPWPYIFAAEVKLEENKIAEAAPYLEKVARRVPQNEELYEFWIRSLFESNNIEGMLSALEFWLDKKPETLSPYFLYIDYQLRFEKYDEANRVLDHIKGRWQEDSRISYFQGLSKMVEDDADSVWFYFERAHKAKDTTMDLYLNYGIWFWEKEYFDNADLICDLAIDKFGPSTQWLHMKAMINAQRGRYEVAEYLLEMALSADTLNVNIMEDLANVYVDLNKGDQSVHLYEKVLAALPENRSILNNYAFVLSRLDRDLDKAMKMVNQALKKEKSAAFCDTKAWILYRQKKYKRALIWIEKALKYQDIGADLFYHKGEILKAMGMMDDAKEAYNKALSMNPDYPEAMNALEDIK